MIIIITYFFLDVFKFDENYEENEGKYKTLSKEILQTDSESESGSEGSDEDSDEEDDDEDEGKTDEKIIDNTETNLITLRRTIYLTIQSSLDFEECAHKLLKMELKPGQEIELCHMFLGNTPHFQVCRLIFRFYTFIFLIQGAIFFSLRLLRRTANLRKVLRFTGSKILSDQQDLRGTIPTDLQGYLRHHPPVGREQTEKRQQVLCTPALHRRHQLGGVGDHEVE